MKPMPNTIEFEGKTYNFIQTSRKYSPFGIRKDDVRREYAIVQLNSNNLVKTISVNDVTGSILHNDRFAANHAKYYEEMISDAFEVGLYNNAHRVDGPVADGPYPRDFYVNGKPWGITGSGFVANAIIRGEPVFAYGWKDLGEQYTINNLTIPVAQMMDAFRIIDNYDLDSMISESDMNSVLMTVLGIIPFYFKNYITAPMPGVTLREILCQFLPNELCTDFIKLWNTHKKGANQLMPLKHSRRECLGSPIFKCANMKTCKVYEQMKRNK